MEENLYDYYGEEENSPDLLIGEECFCKHYVLTREDGAIVDGWSDGVKPERDTNGAICINDRGGYQFEIVPGGDGLPLCAAGGIPLYKWDGSRVVSRTEAEIEADRAAIPAPPPTAQQQLRADVDFIAAMTGVTL